MKPSRRNFFKTFFISLSIWPFIKFDLFFPNYKRFKLKKKKKFIWYLNSDD